MLGVLFVLSVIFYGSKCFNLDTNFPVIYVDPERNVPGGEKGSYFGLSIILRSWNLEETSQAWIKIGAPKGLDRNKIATGLVYHCHIKNNRTHTTLVGCDDSYVPEDWGYYDDAYKDKSLIPDVHNNAGYRQNIKTKGNLTYVRRSSAFFGGAMEASNTDFIVGSSRYIKKYDRKNYPIGACLHKNTTLKPFDFEVRQNDLFREELAQFGFSLHITKENELMIGAPGLYNWKGGVILYRPDMIHFNFTNSILSFDLFGYSVSSGNFFSRNETLYATGAPNHHQNGKVLVYDVFMNVRQSFEGPVIGEYFGASLAVLDVNNDGFDDLIIGAPFYSLAYNEGKIYVFVSKPKGEKRQLEVPVQGAVLEGKIPGGMFGYAMRGVGDLNRDGFDDVVVGAPFADGQHGVVYVYNGGASGLNPTASQEIRGRWIHESLRGFGVSFSNAADVDGNNYNDVAIGAHKSGHVVLLRSRPVVHLQFRAESSLPHLSHDVKLFDVKVCNGYTGQYKPQSIEIVLNVQADTDYGRIYTYDKDNKVNEFTQTYRLQLQQKELCDNIQFYIKENNTNFQEPIKIMFTSKLVDRSNISGSHMTIIRGKDSKVSGFCKNCPVRGMNDTAPFVLEVPFVLDCGDDNICNPDLMVTARFKELKSNIFIIKSEPYLTLEITVENVGEYGFNTQVEFKLPKNVYLQVTPLECSLDGNTITWYVDNPFKTGIEKRIDLILDMDDVVPEKGVEFTIRAKSKQDLTPENNMYTIKLDFETDANLVIIGNNEGNGVLFSNETFVNVNHTYEVIKTGLSPLDETVLEILVPVRFQTGKNTENFMHIHEPYVVQDQTIGCTTKDFEFEPQITPNSNTTTPQDDTFDDYFVESVENEKDDTIYTRSKRSTNNPPEMKSPDNRTLFINCSDDSIKCITISCNLQPFKKPDGYAKLELKMRMNVSIIESILNEKDIIYITTHGTIKELNGPRRDHTSVSTTILTELKQKQIALWIIIASAVAGLLLLIIIIIILIKVGFFKRTKKDQLIKLKEAGIAEEFFPYVNHPDAKRRNSKKTEDTGNMNASIIVF